MAHTMSNQEYSLKWSNHTENILMSLETLLQSENLVDVTLICGKTSLRAHRVILSVCSPYFQKIFAETPCNHPVVVLHDFRGADVQDLLTFMYRGEVSVVQSRLESILKAAESLQIRGLGDHNKNSLKPPEPVHAVIYEGDENGCGNRFINERCPLRPKNPEESAEDGDGTTPVRLDSISPSSSSNYELTTKQTKRNYMEVPTSRHKSRSECPSPVYRRKQARPRRCSKDNSTVQDLSTCSSRSPQPQEEVAENLCTKKSEERYASIKREFKTSSPDLPKSPEMDMRDFRTSPLSLLQPHMTMNHEMDNHPHMPFPPMPSVSALTMTAPQGKFFGLDSQPLALFPPGLENCRNNFFELDHRAQEHQNVKKKSKSKKRRKKPAVDKLGRPKGQHSAPRGGPPRSWTNNELTEALQHVWNKKMTTSQASRVFGIPYNSLLMYVRGKYGKSLRLEQLRKDCMGSPAPTSELLSMNTTNNNNTVVKNEREPEPVQPNTRPSSAENIPQPSHPNYLAHLIPPYFPADFHNFPLPMMHQFMGHGDRSREHFSNQAPPLQPQSQHKSEDHSNSEALDEDSERFRSPSMDERRDVVAQQNGQN